ncbi:unnamed protein product, partial [Didymodactylos carnosus]
YDIREMWLQLPDLVWYHISQSMSLNDISHLSETSKAFHHLINCDMFWTNLIRVKYGRQLSKRHTVEIFANSNQDKDLYRTLQTEKNERDEFCSIPDNYIIYKPPFHNGPEKDYGLALLRSYRFFTQNNGIKMAISRDQFRMNVQYSRFNNELLNAHCVVLSKLIFFYLYDKKRQSCFESRTCRQRVFSCVMPGKYNVIWLLKLSKPRVVDEVEFCAVPDYGRLARTRWSQRIFDEKVQHGTNSFFEIMGTITVYEISNVHVGMMNWVIPEGIAWDYVELKIVA